MVGIVLQTGYGQASISPFVITISTDRSVVNAGSEVYFTARITNTSNHNVDCASIPSEGLDLTYQYVVHRASGEPVAKLEKAHPEFGQTFNVMPPCTLKPKESHDSSLAIIISRLYDMSVPGKYIIQVLRPIANSGNPKYGLIKSNELTITVLPAESKPSQ
jgi:hypothetical protein